MSLKMPVMLSNHHVHLTEEALYQLFGEGYRLSAKKELGGGEFAANETLVCRGSKGCISGIRILGPLRRYTQVELLRSDCFALGVDVPVRDSGDLAEAAPLTLIGPKGEITLDHVAIIAQRHVHMNTATAEQNGIKNLDTLQLSVGGDRALVFHNVVAKVASNALDVIHLDMEEGNAAGLNNGDIVELHCTEASV